MVIVTEKSMSHQTNLPWSLVSTVSAAAIKIISIFRDIQPAEIRDYSGLSSVELRQQQQIVQPQHGFAFEFSWFRTYLFLLQKSNTCPVLGLVISTFKVDSACFFRSSITSMMYERTAPPRSPNSKLPWVLQPLNSLSLALWVPFSYTKYLIVPFWCQ